MPGPFFKNPSIGQRLAALEQKVLQQDEIAMRQERRLARQKQRLVDLSQRVARMERSFLNVETGIDQLHKTFTQTFPAVSDAIKEAVHEIGTQHPGLPRM